MSTTTPPVANVNNAPVGDLVVTGQAQQGGSIVTYATAFHSAANDGYFIQAAGSARSIIRASSIVTSPTMSLYIVGLRPSAW